MKENNLEKQEEEWNNVKNTATDLISLVPCFSYSNAYDQQYQVGDTGLIVNGTVTNVTVTETNTDTTYETIDFIEMTDTFVYTETITESVRIPLQQQLL